MLDPVAPVSSFLCLADRGDLMLDGRLRYPGKQERPGSGLWPCAGLRRLVMRAAAQRFDVTGPTDLACNRRARGDVLPAHDTGQLVFDLERDRVETDKNGSDERISWRLAGGIASLAESIDAKPPGLVVPIGTIAATGPRSAHSSCAPTSGNPPVGIVLGAHVRAPRRLSREPR